VVYDDDTSSTQRELLTLQMQAGPVETLHINNNNRAMNTTKR